MPSGTLAPANTVSPEESSSGSSSTDDRTPYPPTLTTSSESSITLFPTQGREQLKVDINLPGSLQNPAWSPEGDKLVFTLFSDGYNLGPADIMVFDLKDQSLVTLVSDGSVNVNLPGSVWNPAVRRIVFASSREPHDEIYMISDRGRPGGEIRITYRTDRMSYEPSLSPDGLWVVFESHPLDAEGNGVVTVFKTDGTEPYREITGPLEDCRQPNWSPAGDWIVYQAFTSRQWDLWVVNADGSDRRRITNSDGDETDASFSPDGKWIVFSAGTPAGESVNLFVIPVSGGDPVLVTQVSGYAGAPSWSPDGEHIAFEYSPGDPDGSAGTTIWTVAAPRL